MYMFVDTPIQMCSEILNTFCYLSSQIKCKCMLTRQELKTMLVRIANKEEHDQTVFRGQSGSVLFQL